MTAKQKKEKARKLLERAAKKLDGRVGSLEVFLDKLMDGLEDIIDAR